MTLKFAVVAAIALASCVPTNRQIQSEGEARSSAAQANARKALAGIRKEWDAATNASIARWNAKIIFPICNGEVPKGNDCGMLHAKFSDAGFQKGFVTRRCATVPKDATADFCSDLFASDFLTAMHERYGLWPKDVCAGQDCTSYFDIELAMLKAFNAKVGEQSEGEADRINAEYSARSAAVRARFTAQTDRIERETAGRIQDAGRRRAAMMAVAQGLQAAGSSLQNRPAYAYTPPPTQIAAPPSPAPMPEVQSPTSCASDFECGLGNVCAKDSFAFRGICARAVNAYGTPTYQAPRSGSVLPGTGDCSFDTECSIGFRCVKTSGGLRGNCMK